MIAVEPPGDSLIMCRATVMVIQEPDVQLVDREPRFTDADWQRLVDTAADRVEELTDR